MHLHPTPEAEPARADRPQAAEVRRERMRPGLRRLLWVGGVALLVLLLVLTPPLVNANGYRKRIADTMSASLGRPVHLDEVSLHLLPTPGFTLRNLVVSEDPAFGSEPTIRANTVEATLRVSSLWRRPVEFSTIRFVEPSVNLVRDSRGRWNLSEVLLRASHIASAPTGQRRAGPTPRFPYIEATSARVNVKLGVEKLPFSLTDADFALWLPSPQQWRVRLVGSPARTDTAITDPGRMRMEGELRRADSLPGISVNFDANWHNAPLGEATRLLFGEDWGWRGTLNADASLAGTLGDAQLHSKITLGGVRRAEFFPAHPVALQITCGSRFAVHPAALEGLRCTLPDDSATPLTLQAATVPLQRLAGTAFTLQGPAIPVRWLLYGAALFSARVPTGLQPTGTVDVDIAHQAPGSHAAPVMDSGRKRRGLRPRATPMSADQGAWSGQVTMHLPTASSEGSAPAALPNVLVWALAPSGPGESWPRLQLASTPVIPGPGAIVTMGGVLSQSGYTLQVNGTAAPAALLLPARYVPELGDGLETSLPFPPTGSLPLKVQIGCTRTWTAAQVCSNALMSPGRTSTTTDAASGAMAGIPAPRAPGPQNLSPLERAPFSTPRPGAVPSAPQ